MAGFSLAEVIVAGGLLSMVALTAGTMMTQSLQHQKQLRIKNDLLQLQNQVQASAASPLALKNSAEAVAISYRGFHIGIIDLTKLVGDGKTADPLFVTPDREIYTKPPLFDPSIVYQRLLQNAQVVDPMVPMSTAAGTVMQNVSAAMGQ